MPTPCSPVQRTRHEQVEQMGVVAHGHHAGQGAIEMGKLIVIPEIRQIPFDGRQAAVLDEFFRPGAVRVQGHEWHQVVDQGHDGGRVGDQRRA